MFHAAVFDLPAYLARIGFEGAARPDLHTLRALTLQHPIAIPFENLDPFFGRPVALDGPSLQRKMVQDGRGGYCFEHNLLLGTALTAVGFDVIGLGARVMWNNPPDVTMPRTHMLLHVLVDGHAYLADAGFGGLTLTGPLRLEPGIEQETPHERFRLIPAEDGFVMQAKLPGGWKPLYRFDLQPQALADYELTSWYLCHNPRSHFIRSLVAARADRGRRYGLRNVELVTHHGDGLTERRVLGTPAELREALTGVFGIRMPEGLSFEDAVARLAVPVA